MVLVAVIATFLAFGSAHMPPLSDLRFPYGENNDDFRLPEGANPATMMHMPELYFMYGGVFCELFVSHPRKLISVYALADQFVHSSLHG